jgi:hypothetical protein
MVKIFSFVLIVFLFFITSCDFFFSSAFPNYLPSVRRVENLDKYFNDSNHFNYEMFVLNDDMGNDFLFVLYKPESDGRKVVVMDGGLKVQSDYEDTNLGSLHASFSNTPTRAAVGAMNITLDTYTWDPTPNISSDERDHMLILDHVVSIFYRIFMMDGNEFLQSYGHDNNEELNYNSAGDGSFQIGPSGTEFFLENAAFCDNNTAADTADDVVLLYVRRRTDNDCIALAIPDITFPNSVNMPAVDYYAVMHFGPIKPGSVHVKNNGMSVILEEKNGTVVHYWYNGGGFDWTGDINGMQFDDRVVAYSPYRPDYYVFDPATKDIFKCDVWWHIH